MKILYVTTISNTVNTFLVPHIELLLNKGHQVDIACSVKRDISPSLLRRGCNVFDIKFNRSTINVQNIKAYMELKKIVSEGDYDLIHTHTPIASFFTRLVCKKEKNIKVVYTAHGFHFFKGASLKNWVIYYSLERWAANFTDAIITINEEDFKSAQKMKLKKGGMVFKVNGVGLDLMKFSPVTIAEKKKLRSELKINQNDFILFYAAELNNNKNQNLLIDMINIVRVKIPNVMLLLAGDGNLKSEYKEKINDLKLADNIKILGSRDDVSDLLKVSDIVVASSKREGLPVNIMEAMSTGIPLVLTDCRGHRDLVQNNKNGFLIGCKDDVGFAQAIEKIYYCPKLKESFSKENILKSKSYSQKQINNEISEIYSNYLKMENHL